MKLEEPALLLRTPQEGTCQSLSQDGVTPKLGMGDLNAAGTAEQAPGAPRSHPQDVWVILQTLVLAQHPEACGLLARCAPQTPSSRLAFQPLPSLCLFSAPLWAGGALVHPPLVFPMEPFVVSYEALMPHRACLQPPPAHPLQTDLVPLLPVCLIYLFMLKSAIFVPSTLLSDLSQCHWAPFLSQLQTIFSLF